MERIDPQEQDLKFALRHLEKLDGVNDLIRFWYLVGPYRMAQYPEVEKIRHTRA
jgi:hypothetical protein